MIPETPGLVLLLLALLALMALLLIKETPGVVPVVLPALLLPDREIPGTVLAALLAALLPRQAPETLGTAPVAPRDLPLLRALGILGIALVALMVAPLLLGPPGLGTVLVLLVLPPLRDLLSTAGGKRSLVSVCYEVIAVFYLYICYVLVESCI
ncbi:hypothetical protein ABZX51_002602 [Aspergillus tubingensis]